MELFSAHHVGGRGGNIGFPQMRNLHSSIAATSYEVDPNCCPQIKYELKRAGYGAIQVIPSGIGHNRLAKFYMNYDPYTSSLLKLNPRYANYYLECNDYDYIARDTFAIIKELEINLESLDTISKLYPIDFLSIDTQGSEHEILQSAELTLKNAIGIYTEVNFIELYKDCPLFGEISNLLTSNDFEFIKVDLHDAMAPCTITKSGRLEKINAQGDALFLRRADSKISEIQRRKLVFAALAFGQIEYAALCAEGLRQKIGHPKNHWQYIVDSFIRIISKQKAQDMPKLFSEEYSLENSYQRATYAVQVEESKIKKFIKRLKPIVTLIRALRRCPTFLNYLKASIIAWKRSILEPRGPLEELYDEMNLPHYSKELRKLRLYSEK